MLRIAGWLYARRPRNSVQISTAIRITGDDRFGLAAFRTDPLWASGARGLLELPASPQTGEAEDTRQLDAFRDDLAKAKGGLLVLEYAST